MKPIDLQYFRKFAPRLGRAVGPHARLWAVCAVAGAMSACARPVPEHRGRDNSILAQTYGSRIEAMLPASVPVPAARAAAQATLRGRGYVITETFGTDDNAQILASGTGERRSDSTSVRLWRAGQGTWVSVDPGLWGDVAPARSILDEIIARLGR